MTDLSSRIREAVERRQALAEAATPGPWGDPEEEHDNGGDSGFWIYNGRKGTDEYGVLVVPLYNPRADSDAAHIAANNPANTLAECRYALGVLERHQAVDPYDLRCRQCYEGSPWPCTPTRALAERWGVALTEEGQ